MRFLLALVLLLSSIHISLAHEYYFAFAEAQYNHTTKRIELSLSVSTHDIEHYLQDKGVKVKELEDFQSDTLMQKEFSIELLKGISFSINSSVIGYKLIGYQVNKNGLTDFFFQSEVIELSNEIKVRFDLLMNQYKEQQNKMTFIYNLKKHTYPFTQINKEQIIHLDSNEE